MQTILKMGNFVHIGIWYSDDLKMQAFTNGLLYLLNTLPHIKAASEVDLKTLKYQIRSYFIL